MSDGQNRASVNGDAIALIQATAVRADMPRFLRVPGGPEHVQQLVTPVGVSVVPVVAEPEPRRHTFETLGSLIEFTQKAAAREHGPAKPVVWFNEASVCVVVDDETRRDHGGLTLHPTRQFQMLATGSTSGVRNQAEFVRFLRIDMAGTLPADSSLLALVRNLRFNQSAQGTGKVGHGDESITREILDQVLGQEAIPEEITLNVRVYETPDLQIRAPIRCAIDILAHEQQLRLVPLCMECEDAIAFVVSDIGKRLRDNLDCPVYRGAAFNG